MENYYGIKEIECVPHESANVIKKRKRKPTPLGVLAFGLTALTFAAYVMLALRSGFLYR